LKHKDPDIYCPALQVDAEAEQAELDVLPESED
jgi:hypothetical protein